MSKLSLFLLILVFPTIGFAQNSDINGVYCTDVYSDKNGNVFVCGYFQGFVNFGRSMLRSDDGSTDMFLAKFSKDGGNVWAVKAGGEETDVATGVIVDDDGYIYLTGYFQSTASFEYRKIKSKGQSDMFVAKYSPSGNINMLKTYGGKGNDQPIGIGRDTEGNIYLAGTYTDRLRLGDQTLKPVGTYSAFASKFSPQLSAIWSTEIGSREGSLLLNDFDVDANGNLYMCGSYDNVLIIGTKEMPSKGDLDAFALKLTSSGGLTYTKFYASPDKDLARAIKANNNGNAMMAGHTVQGMSGRTGYLYELDASGNKGKTKTWDLGFETKFQDLTIGDNNEIFICGSFNEHEDFDKVAVNCSGLDGFLVKSDNNLNPKWGFASGGQLSGLIECMHVDIAGNSFVGVNRPRIQGTREQAVFLGKIDKDANLIWSTEVGAAEKSEQFDPNAHYIDFRGKLLMGSELLTPVVESYVELTDGTGNVLETTLTDDYGDFVFHNLNVENEYSVKAKEAVEESSDEPVYIANQYGKILGEFDKQGESKFDYKILPAELAKLSEMEEYDSKLEVADFMNSSEKEAVIDMQIYYEPGAYEVPSVYYNDLKTIARRIKGHTEIEVEIASYTDAIGDAASNKTLSQKRADAIVEYLIRRGIREDQISGKGYGETGITNRCVDGVDNCSDSEHQANRRTEIRLNRTSKR